MEEQLAAGLGEGQVAELVEHNKVEPGQVIGFAPGNLQSGSKPFEIGSRSRSAGATQPAPI